MNNPLISIIIPIYNVKAYLRECLESVLNQSYKNLDIILIDDASTDESLNIALEYLNQDERIFLISKQNAGLSSARNLGLEFIKGTQLRSFFEEDEQKDILSFTTTHSFKNHTKIIKKEEINSQFTLIQKRYIKTKIENINDFIIQELPPIRIHFLDSDDYLLKDCIASCVRMMLEKDLDLCAHDIKEYHEKSKEFIKKDFFEKSFNEEFYRPLALLKLNKKYHFYFTWQGMFKASLLNKYKLRFTHGIYHEDHDFGTILFCLATKMFYIKKALIIYRLRQGSITHFSDKMPDVLPKNLEPLRGHFHDYKELRTYFQIYCYLMIAKKLQSFNQKLKDSFLKEAIKRYYIFYFDFKMHEDPLRLKEQIKFFVKNLKYYSFYVRLRHYLRHPKKLLECIISFLVRMKNI